MGQELNLTTGKGVFSPALLGLRKVDVHKYIPVPFHVHHRFDARDWRFSGSFSASCLKT